METEPKPRKTYVQQLIEKHRAENPVFRAAYDEEEALYQLSLQKKSADAQQASSNETDAS
jgi:hypothetical protein